MEQEFAKDYDWSDWKNVTYSLKEQWEYVDAARAPCGLPTYGARPAPS